MVTSIVTWILAVIVVGLRILSRRMKNISLWIDDWLIIAALVHTLDLELTDCDTDDSLGSFLRSCLWDGCIWSVYAKNQYLSLCLLHTTNTSPAVSRGLGKHVWADPPDAQYAWAIGLFIAELGYFVTIACVKWSILAFYWRSFKIRSSVKIPIYILAVIVLLWATSVVSP